MNNFEDFKYIKGFGGGGGSSQAPSPTAAYEDVEGFVYNGQPYGVYQFAKVKDLLSEGPIGGLLEGQYLYSGQVGDLGFKKVIYSEYPSVIGQNSEAKYLRSIQWNKTPLLDSQEKYNFQQINVQVTNGTPEGTSLDQGFDSVSYIRSIGERLRGPNQLARTTDEVLDYQRTYRILNKECKKISLNFRISSLYVTLKYQDLKSVSDGSIKIEGVESATTTDFKLSRKGRETEDGNVEAIVAGAGSVIRNKFKIRIKISPIYNEGYNANLPALDLTSNTATVIKDDKDLVINVDNVPKLFEIESDGKVTQGYSKQITLNTSNVFSGLNENQNWAGWDITVLKITPEDTFSARASFISLESITEIYSSSFRYTNSAIVTSKFNAGYFSKIPERSYDVNLLKVKVPFNYNPITKTYGVTTPLATAVTTTISKTDEETTEDFFLGENGSYVNTDNINPPIKDGLAAQFNASDLSLTTSTGVVTNWPNAVAGSNIKCVLGDGNYASPTSANSALAPKYGVGYSEQSPNGTYGVTFETTQKVKFIRNADSSEAISKADFTVFIVCKWHSSAASNERNSILASFPDQGYFIFGQTEKINRYFVGSYANLEMQGFASYASKWVSRSNYWGTVNDDTTYIIGLTQDKTPFYTMFWQNTIRSKQINTSSAPPLSGLSINHTPSIQPALFQSKCTVFEVLVYDRKLATSESISVRNWLNKKWNVLVQNITSVPSSAIPQAFNPNVFDIPLSSSISIPLKTLCANGQATKAFNYEGGAQTFNPNYYQFDLIASTSHSSSVQQPQKAYLKDQGFSGCYCDFFIKLKDISYAGTYCLINRDNQFNLSMAIAGESVSLILKIISPNDGKIYTITKQLIASKYSTTKLKNTFTRITLYILPKVVNPKVTFNEIARVTANINLNDKTWNKTPLVDTQVLEGRNPISTKGLPSPLIQGVSFKEDSLYNSQISNLAETCSKYFYGNTTETRKQNGSFSTNKSLSKEFFPNILNAEIDVLLNSEKQIQCNINIDDYNAYQTLCVGNAIRPLDFNRRANDLLEAAVINQLNADTQNQLRAYNRLRIDQTFLSDSVTLEQNQTVVLLPLTAAQIYDAANDKTGPFIPSYFITNNKNIEIFKDTFVGYADSIKVNQISFDRISLSKAFSGGILSEGYSKKISTYDTAGVLPYSSSNDYWDGTFKEDKEWTDNPAWCFYDLLTNKRYGAGNYVSEADVDKWSLYQIAKYCDELVADGFGGVEPRFSCNVYLQSQEDALKVLADMASVFRGMFYYSNGFIYTINDMPENTPVYSFANSNVTDGNFNYESTSLKDRNSAVYIRYIDKNNFYKPAVEYVENIEAFRKFGFKETELTAFGCTSRGQAQRLGRWLLASEYNETETVSFEAGPESVYLKPGDVIKVHDYYKKHKTVGGRLSNINISGDVNVTTGTLTLDRKLDFNFSGNQNYKFTIVSPKYNLDPSFAGAVTSNIDYNDYRQPLTNSFIINSGNLITGQYYDSIRVTGLAPVMASGLNVTGLAYFTGASGMSPKSITWALENSGNLNGTTDSDYDFYRIFRIQESTEGTNYTVIASQMYHLKYTQIESGLNITPAKAPTPEASAPLRALFTSQETSVVLDIFYDSLIKNSTIGFKVFAKNFYQSDFDPNKDTNFKFVSIDLYESFTKTTLTKSQARGFIRVYGVNINNSSPLSYVEAVDSTDALKTTAFPVQEISYNNVIKEQTIVNNVTYEFDNPITLNRNQYFAAIGSSLNFNIPLNFINKVVFNNIDYPYRVAIIPELVDSKAAFVTAFGKYSALDLVTQTEYLTFDSDNASDNGYLYNSLNTLGRYRSFSLAIDKGGLTDKGFKTTSDSFKQGEGFLLVTYNNKDAEIIASLGTLLNGGTYAIYPINGTTSRRLVFNITTSADNFVNFFYLLLTPKDTAFSFAKYTIIHDDDGEPKSIKLGNDEIIDSHFIKILKDQPIFYFDKVQDDSGKSFNLDSYEVVLIAVDSFMIAWQYSSTETSRKILDYYSKSIDGANQINTTYPLISAIKTIEKAAGAVPLSYSLENVLKTNNGNYVHFSINKTVLTQSRVLVSFAYGTQSNEVTYWLSRQNVIYKPTLGNNLTANSVDNKVIGSEPAATNSFCALSLQNRDLTGGSFPLNVKIEPSKRAYVLNGNKIFTRALELSTESLQKSPVLLKSIDAEVGNNKYKVKSGAIPSEFGLDRQEFFDISITRIIQNTNFLGANKGVFIDFSKEFNFVSSSNNTIPAGLTDQVTKGLFNGAFNCVNVTPRTNFDQVLTPSEIEISINPNPTAIDLPFITSQEFSAFTGITKTNFNRCYGVPVLKNENLKVVLTIPNVKKRNNIKIFCFLGDNFVNSEIDITELKVGTNNITVTLKDLPYANYFTYRETYANDDSINNATFWKFQSIKNLSFAHFAVRKLPFTNNSFSSAPFYFYIQTLELSIVMTYA
jgi:hypothetical protein